MYGSMGKELKRAREELERLQPTDLISLRIKLALDAQTQMGLILLILPNLKYLPHFPKGQEVALYDMGKEYDKLKIVMAELRRTLREGEGDKPRVDFSRSHEMHLNGNLGVDQGKTGVWKVGENHAADMIPMAPKKYQLLGMSAFNDAYDEWLRDR